ncbi:aspartate/glutamate racemase family protein [Hafnia alvei]|uniref:aspartate/glutamate racemase family protein n=1 Tax=Hafnia alvei TaxID=569 RepID=UPI000DFB82BA|nr:aspartate/glutamate racemase family protein [Hafnia alvei]STQ71803.1 putative racemase [Hafnia alvei]
MKTLGLLGGMSWESTVPYYRIINETVKNQLGGLHSARLVLYSVDFAEVEHLQMQGEWQQAGELLADAAQRLQAAGAEGIVVCTNTMHKVAEQIQARSGLPLLHIADATAARIQAKGLTRIGLLGTRFTMEQDFYRGRLTDTFGIEVIVPNESDREIIHRIIYQELCLGQIRPESRQQYREIMQRLAEQCAQGIILGCTEIALLVDQTDADVPLFDTAQIHAEYAAHWALGNESV